MSTSQSPAVDNIDSLLDLSDFDTVSSQSPFISSQASTKGNGFQGPRPLSQAPSRPMPTSTQNPQSLPGPSHQYELYKQQTGLVPGALASTTLAVSNSQVPGYNPFASMDFLQSVSPSENMFDFNVSPSQSNDLDMDFDSPSDSNINFFDTVSPNTIGSEQQTSPNMAVTPVLPTQNDFGRVWPGIHSQTAMAKAQAQQRQQQQIIQQQRQNAQGNKPRSKSQQPADPMVEQRITQLLNSMRAKPPQGDGSSISLPNLPKLKKDEEEMDEDERLLASEEGKKLSSKERRQLRNKVSARAFRARRKDYITQLESEIQTKFNENSDLRAQNKALIEENRRLSDLTRMLLKSQPFSNFLNDLTADAAANAPQQQEQQQQPHTKQEQSQTRQLPKDVNPAAYAAATQVQRQQQIGMTMVPEQQLDYAMLTDPDVTFNYQPQVFAVLETPEMPESINTGLLSGKETNFVGEQLDSDDEKVELPRVECPAAKTSEPKAPEEAPVDPEFEADPEFALFHTSSMSTEAAAPVELDPEAFSEVDIFGGLESEKVLARYDLVDASEEEQASLLAAAKVQRLCEKLETIAESIERLTFDE